MKKALISVIVSAAMVTAPLPVLAAETGPLAPGGAAGVKEAQASTFPPLVWLVGAGLVIALGILALTNNNGGGGGTTTTTGTVPQGQQ